MNNHIRQMKKAAEALLAEIDKSTDCMSNQIKRERIDSQIEALERAITASSALPAAMSFTVQELRPEVLEFALLMEARLREKGLDKAQSWKNAEMQHLRVNMVAKAGMLEHALGGVEHGRPLSVAATKHAVDLANYTMMIADVAGALADTDDNGGAGWAGLDALEIPAFLRAHRDE